MTGDIFCKAWTEDTANDIEAKDFLQAIGVAHDRRLLFNSFASDLEVGGEFEGILIL